MSYCVTCKAKVKGSWPYCPLCATTLEDRLESVEEKASAFPTIAMRYNRQKLIRIFILISVLTIGLYFIMQWIWQFEFFGLEYMLFGMMITWLTILILVRKRSNIFKAINYLLVLFSLISLYFDYGNGGSGWSVTFVIPILSIATLMAIFISPQLVMLKIEDYVLYQQLAAILGIVPLIFLLLGWVGHPLPSLISVIFSFILFIVTTLKHRSMIKSELEKRFHV